MAEHDDYESRFMADGGGVLLREKIVSRGSFAFLGGLATAMAGGGVAMLATQQAGAFAAIPFGVSLILGACSVLFTVLRTVVSREHVHIQQGFAGPKIPTREIESVDLETYDWKAYGGYGLKMRSDGTWAYSSSSAGTGGVRITWKDEAGKRHACFVSSREPERLRDAIQSARARAPYRDAVRVDAREASGEAVEVEASREGGVKGEGE